MPIFKKKAAKKEAAMDQKKDSKSDLAMAVATSRFAKGGKVKSSAGERGVLGQQMDAPQGVSHAGSMWRKGYKEQAKTQHETALREQKMMARDKELRGSKLYAQGGSVTSHRGSESGHEKGINKRHDPYIGKGGGSQAGYDARGARKNARPEESKRSISNQIAKDYLNDAKAHHKQTLEEMRSMKKPNLYAQGGEVHCHDGSCYADGGMVCGHPYSIPEVLRCKFMADGGLVEDQHDEIEHSDYFDELNQDIADEPIYEDDAEREPRDSNEMGDKLADEDAKGKSIFKKIKMKKAQPGDRG